MKTTKMLAILVLAMGLFAEVANADFTFGTPTNLGPTINRGPTVNSIAEDSAPSISSDGLTLYFSSNRTGGSGSYDLWVATRATTDDEWSTTANLGPTVNGSYYDDWPSISSDGLSLYFCSTRPGGFGNDDLWVTTRPKKDDDWGTPVNLGASVNSSANEDEPSISADGLSLYFSSERPGGSGSYDLWVATRKSRTDNWSAPVNLGPTVNSGAVEARPSISADGLSLFFSSARFPRYGSFDLWVTTRATKENPWGTPVNLGSTVNSSAWDSDPSISADGLSLFFGSYRQGGSGGLDIFVVTRPTVTGPFGAPVDISANYEARPSISADGLELFFDSDRPGGYGYEDLWVASRETTDDDWSTPVNLGPTVNSSGHEIGPRISPDGLSLFFATYRAGGSGYLDLWVTTRATKDTPWGMPVNLGPNVNSYHDEWSPSISADGLSLFFGSGRSGGQGSYDLWVARRPTVSDPWGSAESLPRPVNSSAYDDMPSISADGRTLYFISNRASGLGSADLWMTTRPTTDADWGTPVNLGTIVNSPSNDNAPNISIDGSILYFSSNRPGGFGGFDIWQAPIMPLADLNKNGIVEFKDFATLAEYWLWGATWHGGLAGTELTFGTPTHLGWDVNMNWTKDASPSISADGLTLFFESHRAFAYGAGDLWVTTRMTIKDDWGRPSLLPAPVNSSSYDDHPDISNDGLSLYFCSDRPGGSGNADLWVTTRATIDGDWDTPVNLGATINSSADETAPSISADGLSLFFDSYRPGGTGSWDIWMATRPTTDGDWGAPVPLQPLVNSSSIDGEPSISADGRTLYFISDRPGGYGDYDLWVTTRKTTGDDWGTPVNLGPTVNQTYEDMGPDISADGSTLYFTAGGPVGFLDLYEFDLWQVPVW